MAEDGTFELTHDFEDTCRKVLCQVEALAASAQALELLGSSFAARVLREAAAHAAYDDATKDQVEQSMKNMLEKEAQGMQTRERADIVFKGVVAQVLCEAVPALDLGIIFLSLSWHRLDSVGLSKTVVTLAFSAQTCLTKVAKCFAIRTKCGYAVGFAILAWVSLSIVRFVGLFLCAETHQLSIFVHPGCVVKVSGTVA